MTLSKDQFGPQESDSDDGANCPLGWKPGYKTRLEQYMEESDDGTN